MTFLLALLVGLVLASHAWPLDLPPLRAGVNDLAGMFSPASTDDLNQRLHRFHTETAASVVVITVKSTEGDELQRLVDKAFKSLPFGSSELTKTALLLVARKERLVGLQAGAELRHLLPAPMAQEKLESQVALYWDGLRPDLGIHGAVHYLLRVIRGDLQVGSQTEQEGLEDASIHGRAAAAIFALCLGPFLAFFIGGLWGIYATHYGVQRATRLFMGAIFGGATAKLVTILTSLVGHYGDNLWYFIMALAIPLGAFASWTEFWMFGEWSGIPRLKGRRGKPEDHMGI